MPLPLTLSTILPVFCLAIAGVPSVMRPRPGSDVSRCKLDNRQANIQCLMKCIQDPCCLAVDLTAQCEMGYIPADASTMDLIKEPPVVATGDCSCTLETGTSGGGTLFSDKELYGANRSPITKLLANVMNDTHWLFNVGLELADGSKSDGVVDFIEIVECVLNPGERITSADVHLDTFPDCHMHSFVVSGVQFVTTQKTCVMFGTTGSKVEKLQGHRLLYLEGKGELLVDALYLSFDYGCDKKVVQLEGNTGPKE